MVGDVIDSIAYKNCALHMFELNMNMKYEMEEMQLEIGCEHVLYSCGDIGLDQIAEEMADQYGMQKELIVGPNHPRARFNSPATVELLVQANDPIKKAAFILGREVPSHHYTLSLLQRKYHIARKAKTIFAFGVLELNRKEVRGGTGWTAQMALDQGKNVFVFDHMTQTWFHADTFYDVDPATNLLKLETRFRPWGKLPTLDQSSAVIGPRIVGEKTQEEVKNLFHQTFCSPENIEEVRKELEELHL